MTYLHSFNSLFRYGDESYIFISDPDPERFVADPDLVSILIPTIWILCFSGAENKFYQFYFNILKLPLETLIIFSNQGLKSFSSVLNTTG